GPDLLAAVAGRAVAEDRDGQGSRDRFPAHRRAAAPLAGPAGRTGPRLTTPGCLPGQLAARGRGVDVGQRSDGPIAVQLVQAAAAPGPPRRADGRVPGPLATR